MKCLTCVWGRIVGDSESELGHRKIIMCSKIHCPDMPQNEVGDKPMLKKQLIYVCSPLRGDYEANRIRAARYCRFIVDCQAIPIAPHLFFTQFLDDGVVEDRSLGLELGLKALEHCSAVWVFGDKYSFGMRAEMAEAERLGIPVFHFDSLCQPVDQPTISVSDFG